MDARRIVWRALSRYRCKSGTVCCDMAKGRDDLYGVYRYRLEVCGKGSGEPKGVPDRKEWRI